MMPQRSLREQLARNLRRPRGNWIDVRSALLHFALISYTLPPERLAAHIPERFEVLTFPIDGRPMALLSAVPFWDADFRFVHIAPFLKGAFGQTNHRVYVRDRDTGEPCVWFFGTTLGSPIVHAARLLWRIPWHPARYDIDCAYDAVRGVYDRYEMTVHSEWCSADIALSDSGRPMSILPGFASLDEQVLVLTHPIHGFFHRLDGPPGTYSVWHDRLPLTEGRAERAYFSLYERLGLLSRAEMAEPHSVLLCPRTEFDVFLPPRRLR